MEAKQETKIQNNLIYKDLSYIIVGCFYDVYNEIGPAHKEIIYQKALGLAFEQKNLKYSSEEQLKIYFKGTVVGCYKPDFIIDDKIIVEIKSLISMPDVFEKQLFYYLRCSNYKLGYLVNFGSGEIDIRRRVFDSVRDNNLRQFV